MSDGTSIEWCDATWPIVQGCDPVSRGCVGCYVVPLLWRLSHNPDAKISGPLQGLIEKHNGKLRFTGELALREDRLDWPLHWRSPRKIFVPSHGDIFHKDVPEEFIDRIFARMGFTAEHTYQVLTKRHDRMRDYINDQATPDRIDAVMGQMAIEHQWCTCELEDWPLKNVWLGVSCEDQATADERIPQLLDTPAAARFISAEPLLGPVDFTRICILPQKPGSIRAGIHIDALRGRYCESGMVYTGAWDVRGEPPPDTDRRKLDWIIVGGESGADARPMRVDNDFGGMRIVPWQKHSGGVTGQRSPGSSAMGVADPRPAGDFSGKGKYRVTSFGESTGTVIGASTTGQGAFAVADPRPAYGPGRHRNVLRVTPWDRHSGVATGNDHVTGGALCVADPRPRALSDPERDAYVTGGHYGVVDWHETAGAVPAHAKNNNGRWSVADPRVPASHPSSSEVRDGCVEMALPAGTDRLVCVIRALDDTWHRPFTTLELAALQGLVDPEEQLELDGLSDSAWRERIGNAVPPPAAAAIAGVMGRALLAAWSGEISAISSEPVWVRPVAIALMAAQGEHPEWVL